MSVSVRTHHYRATRAKSPPADRLPASLLGVIFKPRSQARQTLPTFLPGDQPGSAPQLVYQLASPPTLAPGDKPPQPLLP